MVDAAKNDPTVPVASGKCPVAVIIPVYNRASIMLPTLASVAQQSLLPTRVIVVDDGSSDGTLNAVAQWVETHQPSFETKLIGQPHAQAAAARNRGLLEMAGLPLVAFLDSDDRWPNDFLARTVSALERNPAIVAATVDRRFVDAEGSVFRRDHCRRLAVDPVSWIFRHGGGIASSTLFRTETVLAVGPWDETMESSEDSMLFVQIALLGRWAHVTGAPVEFHHGNAAAHCEEGNASMRFSDSFRRWAQDYELIYDITAGRYPEPKRRRLRLSVAVFWYRAGKQLNHQGHSAAAAGCFEQALFWNPRFLRAWRRRRALRSRVA